MSANPSSLSFTFQAILEQAMRDEQEADVPKNIDRGFKVLDEMLKRDSDVPPNNTTMDIVLFATWKRIWVEKMMNVEEIYELLMRFFEHGIFLDDVWVDEALQVFDQMGGSESGGVLVKPFFLPYQLKGKRK
ncbi:hypothetical protein T459_29741 [Capsicum annuum]|uniref:Uncharacterized protein n=1 Tax=Capsicum annuum TaxID=4072 RepID=A0A2G2Y6C0_CAPAN|nr:hypothetical protein T459_29741 [Capsicum annuum]